LLLPDRLYSSGQAALFAGSSTRLDCGGFQAALRMQLSVVSWLLLSLCHSTDRAGSVVDLGRIRLHALDGAQ
jgi:hypothetical protein